MVNKITEIEPTNYAIELSNVFKNMPDKARELYFDLMYKMASLLKEDFWRWYQILPFYPVGMKSPIEYIMYVPLLILGESKMFGTGIQFEVSPQYPIECDNKIYYADFLVSLYGIINTEEKEHEVMYELIVECDGHEFHQKTKQQVKKDNEREYAIKMAGYDVLRYSGSQIYNEPKKCAKEIILYCEKKYKVEESKWLHTEQ